MPRLARLPALLLLAAAGVMTLASAPAFASFHLIKIREVYAGTTGDASAQYVEMQLPDAGESFTAGNHLTIYGPTGTQSADVVAPSDVPAVAQETVLWGSQPTVLGVARDFTIPAVLDPSGGAACWAGVDCVSWGSFAGTLPSPAGTPAPAIASGKAIARDISANCSTTLESTDDTNSSAADFSTGPPNPRNTSTAPTEEPCPNTKITDGPSGRTRDRTPTFRFKSVPAGAAGFDCKLDDGHFADCDSPFTLPRQTLGRHTFRVRARNDLGGVDTSPARQSFRVVRRH